VLRQLALTVCSAWISAVLFTAPVLAALECRRCCGTIEAAESVKTCHAAPAGHACCENCEADQPSEPASGSGRCHDCPKCEAKRPVPAAISSSDVWKLPVLAVSLLPSAVSVDVASWSATARVERNFFVRAEPPPRVLFCSWLK
jgi:hypothetical protein